MAKIECGSLKLPAILSGATNDKHLVNVHGKVLGACRQESGGPPDRHHVVQLASPLPGPGCPLHIATAHAPAAMSTPAVDITKSRKCG